MSEGASIPRRTLSPRISTIVTTMSSPIMMLSSRCLDKTSIGGSFLFLASAPSAADYAGGRVGQTDRWAGDPQRSVQGSAEDRFRSAGLPRGRGLKLQRTAAY